MVEQTRRILQRGPVAWLAMVGFFVILQLVRPLVLGDGVTGSDVGMAIAVAMAVSLVLFGLTWFIERL